MRAFSNLHTGQHPAAGAIPRGVGKDFYKVFAKARQREDLIGSAEKGGGLVLSDWQSLRNILSSAWSWVSLFP